MGKSWKGEKPFYPMGKIGAKNAWKEKD